MTDCKQMAEDKLELRAAREGLEIPFDYPQMQIPLWLLSRNAFSKGSAVG